jgi:integrase
MFNALSDFVIYCCVERRLADFDVQGAALLLSLLCGERLSQAPTCCARPRKRKALPDVLDRRELTRLLDAPGNAGVWKRLHAGKVQRNRLLLALFAYGGLRRSELLGLDCEDVGLDRRSIRAQRQGRL